MKKFLFLMALSLMVGFAVNISAAPIVGTYSTWDGTLQTGIWMEDFTSSPHMGGGNSVLTAYSRSGISQTDQWLLDMVSGPAADYDDTAGITIPNLKSDWDYQTAYSGTVTIGGNLTDDGTVDFAVNAMNYNVRYGDVVDPWLGPMLEWRFLGSGTYDGYNMDIEAYYQGAPRWVDEGVFGDLVTAIEMKMVITKAQVPEPSTMLLLGIGLVGIAGLGRRKFKIK